MTKPIILRDNGDVGPAGLRIIEDMARDHKSQRSIAAHLGLTVKAFEKLMDAKKGSNDVRLAWERGFADREQDAIDKVRAAAFGEVLEVEQVGEDGKPLVDSDGRVVKVRAFVPQSKSSVVAAIWYTKTQFGWTEKPQGTLVQDNRIQITVPAPMSRGELLEALGQKEVADFTKRKPAEPREGGVVQGQKPAGLLASPKPGGLP